MQHVVIVTGLGDHTDYIERATKKWPQRHGLQPHVFAFGWEGEVSLYKDHYNEFLNHIRELVQDGPVVLIGISAGASAVMNAARDMPAEVSFVINICGRVRPGRRGLWSFKSFPLHWRSVDSVDLPKLDAAKILTFRSLLDESVPPSTVTVAGATNKRLFIPGHVPSIFWTLYRNDRAIAAFVASS